ncbi:MAG: alpha/beta hydrolase [Desulfosarcinaceae bacterium]|nr:alpha/beta hydrolase [Desulfosarcinaceae bacterium]
MLTESVHIPIDGDLRFSASLTRPDDWQPGHGDAVILAHGAANTKENPLLVAVGDALANAGMLTLRFNFPYADRGKSSPDSQKRLEATWLAAIDWVKRDAGCQPVRLVAAGKSMGGRVASQLAAEQRLDVDRLIFLGYPLHAPGRKDKLRDAHLPAIEMPMLFLTGSRDAFCDLAYLRPVLAALDPIPELVIIEGGNHSFDLPKAQADAQARCYAEIADHCLRWLDEERAP